MNADRMELCLRGGICVLYPQYSSSILPLVRNAITGTIPTGIGAWANLIALDLGKSV